MAVDLYLVIPPSSGNPPISADPINDEYFKTTFGKAPVVEVRQFSLGTENPASIGATTSGAGAGKAVLHELLIEKSVDKASRSLFAISVTGGHLARVQLYVRKAGAGGGKPYLVYGFDTVFISRVEWSASSGDEEPLERVTLAYGGLAIGYYPQRPDGTFDAAVKATWSQVTNTDVVSADVMAGF